MRGLLLLLAIMPSAGSAQALRGHNADGPVDFSADRIEVQDRSDRVVVSGNVKVTQGGLSLDAARLTVAYAKGLGGGDPTVQRLDASGGVTVRSASETARGNFAIYDLNRRLITMIGAVSLNQGGNIVRGGRLVIDLTSGRSIIDGAGASSADGVTSDNGGRVTGRFSVPQRTN